MDTQKSYLFVTWEGGGNVAPVLGLAQRLIERGHRVRVLAEPCLQKNIESIGAEFISFKKYFIRTDRTIDLIQDWNAGPMNLATFDNIIFGPAMDVAEETLAAIKDVHTDVVVADLMMVGSMIAAEAYGIPHVVLFHMPEYLPGPNRPPGGFGLNPQVGKVGQLRDRLLSMVFNRVTGKFLPRLNAVREHFNLAPMRSFLDVYHHADLRLMQTCKAFDFPIFPAPKNVRYVGPILDDPDWSDDSTLMLPNGDSKPLVVVSFSSTFQNQRQAIQHTVTAMADLPINGLVTLGPSMSNERFQAANNIEIKSSCSHSKVLPSASAVVTHAGHGTVMAALSNGLPLVCLPMGRDQIDNAARIVRHGAGLKLSPKAKPREIALAIRRVLNEPEFARNAMRLREHILADVGANRAVLELEQIA